MKKYRIELSADAYEDIEDTLEWLAERSGDAPYRWYSGIMKAMGSLDEDPGRCGLAREDKYFRDELRQMVICNYRIVFTIRKDAAFVTRVRHTARLPYLSEE